MVMHNIKYRKQQQGWVLVVNLLVMALLTSLVMSLWQQVTEQGKIVRHDQQSYRQRQALQQFTHELNRDFIQQHPECQGPHPACSLQINQTQLDYYWQRLAIRPCYELHHHQVEVVQVDIHTESTNMSARVILWFASQRTFNPKTCQRSTKQLQQSKISWLLKPSQ